MKEILRLGVIGLGGRGKGLLNNVLLGMDDVIVTAVCDVYPDRIEDIKKLAKEKGRSEPDGTTDYRVLLDRSDVDAVLIAAAWEYHCEIAVASLEKGKITALEVGGCYSVEDLWDLVRTQERTKTPFMFLENCCYDRSELLVTNMARKGVFGEIVQCSGSYCHDLREEVAGGIENRHYRLRNYLHRNCENYPTHELGPIAKILDINRGNAFVSLVSVATKAAGMKEYLKTHPKAGLDPEKLNFKQGDIVDTIITCAGGETIRLKLHTTTPHYYDREFCVSGTKGFYNQTTNSVWLDGASGEKWTGYDNTRLIFDNATKYEDEYLPEMWKKVTPEILDAGHGGMDYFILRDFVDCAKSGAQMPVDVYDAAAWMAVSRLSEQSIALGGAPVTFPDFTCGKWLVRERKDVIDFGK